MDGSFGVLCLPAQWILAPLSQGSLDVKKGAAILFCMVGLLFLLITGISFTVAVKEDMRKNSPEYRQAQIDAQDAGKEIVEPGHPSLDGTVELILLISGVGFFGAGLALWPKAPRSELTGESQ
jgi:hypothetical protein